MTLRVEGTSENLTHLMVPALYFFTAIIFAGRSLRIKEIVRKVYLTRASYHISRAKDAIKRITR